MPPHEDTLDAGGGDVLTFRLHPLAVLKLSDRIREFQYQAAAAARVSYSSSSSSSSGTAAPEDPPPPPTRMSGCVIGVRRGGTVDVSDILDILILHGPDPATFDRALLEKDQEIYKKAFPDLSVLGWYSIGTNVHATDMGIHHGDYTDMQIHQTSDPKAAVELCFFASRSKAEVIDMLRKHSYLKELVVELATTWRRRQQGELVAGAPVPVATAVRGPRRWRRQPSAGAPGGGAVGGGGCRRRPRYPERPQRLTAGLGVAECWSASNVCWRQRRRCGRGSWRRRLLAAWWWRATAQRRFAEAVARVGGSGDGGHDCGGSGDVGGGDGDGEVAERSAAAAAVVVTVSAMVIPKQPDPEEATSPPATAVGTGVAHGTRPAQERRQWRCRRREGGELMDANGTAFYLLLNPAINFSQKDIPVTIYERVTNTTYKHYKHVLLKIVGVERISLDHADFVYPSPCVVFDVLAPPLGKEKNAFRTMLFETPSGFVMFRVSDVLFRYPEDIWSSFTDPRTAHQAVRTIGFIENIGCWFNGRIVPELIWGLNYALDEFVPQEKGNLSNECHFPLSKQLHEQLKAYGFSISPQLINREFITSFGYLNYLERTSKNISGDLHQKFDRFFCGLEMSEGVFVKVVADRLCSMEEVASTPGRREALSNAEFLLTVPKKKYNTLSRLKRMEAEVRGSGPWVFVAVFAVAFGVMEGLRIAMKRAN
ncbi:hypothetical protein OsJ_32095 [Oryza sativa Japonica Group]|uniref:Uncharacterized protein n=1 Tax=Oryza sativa subsp. japonica TaxID=39947 RepID=B9G6J0_ORYSJ|nr:hypothetical protein OsJ_32095 [Oryza sativa Japonica Group]